MAPAAVLADATHKYDAPDDVVRALLLDPSTWLRLREREVMPSTRELEPGDSIEWSSPWPVAPTDLIVLDLAPWPERRGGTVVRFRWSTSTPPDERGIGKVRYRLNYVFGSEIRGPLSSWWWSHHSRD